MNPTPMGPFFFLVVMFNPNRFFYSVKGPLYTFFALICLLNIDAFSFPVITRAETSGPHGLFPLLRPTH